MKSTSNKKLSQLPASSDVSSLRMVFINEEVINDTAIAATENEKVVVKPKLFVKEPLPLYNDYRFKCKDHDPL
ncbi:hypothetical protein [Niastella populi]|uniref:Uncharacterized protein n=1 Tax=Niastella populi TaxID=550983 RepID=A0A1V9ESZ3_9BACT|nr:hypothetical protein [Niastella populi]OQP49266.1 hypothetical protein A4R26_30945 [Niastella populi]